MAPKAPRKRKSATSKQKTAPESEKEPTPESTPAPRHLDITLDTEMLKVPLTDAELLKFGDDLAQKQHYYTTLDNEKKDVAANYKAKCVSCEGEIVLLSNLLIQKYELRDIEVERRHNYDKGTITVVRMDTGEIVYGRSMTKAESQRELALWPLDETTDEADDATGTTENEKSGDDEPPEPPENPGQDDTGTEQ